MGTITELIYNAEQTGIYYHNIPKHVCVDESNKEDYSAVKKMKYRNRITLMVVTSAGGKSSTCCSWETKKSVILKMIDVAIPPLTYKNQSNYWFDRNITL